MRIADRAQTLLDAFPEVCRNFFRNEQMQKTPNYMQINHKKTKLLVEYRAPHQIRRALVGEMMQEERAD